MRRTVAARLSTILAWRAQALFLTLFWLVVGSVSPDRASAAGSSLARLIGPCLRKHRRVRRNLATALPERPSDEIDALARGVWGNFGAVLAEFPHLAAICRDIGPHSRIELINEMPAASTRPKIFVAAHLANWEIVTGVIRQMGLPLVVIYSPQKNPLVDRLVQKRRAPADCDFVPNAGGLQKAAAALNEGRCLGLLTDQRADGGRPIEFFGLEAETTDVAARLAVGFGCELVPVRVERLGSARFRVTFHEPIEPGDVEAGQKDKALDMTRRLQALFEAWIRERPDQWLCTKRRWQRRRGRPHATAAKSDPSSSAATEPVRMASPRSLSR